MSQLMLWGLLAACGSLFLADAAALRLGSRGATLEAGAEDLGSDETAVPPDNACELCVYALEQIQNGGLPACGGGGQLGPSPTRQLCEVVVQSMLVNTKSIQQSIAQGCDKYMGDAVGWKRVTPCPAHAICGRLGNAFAHDHRSFCPRDKGYSITPSLGSARTEPTGLLGQVIHTYEGKPIMAAPGLPSLLDHYKPTVDEPAQPATAYPSPATASVLPGAVYADYTTRTVVGASDSR